MAEGAAVADAALAAVVALAPCAAGGCEQLGTKLCARCGTEAYCSAECQRRAWKTHKLVCQKADTPELQIDELLKAGRLYSAQEKLRVLAKKNTRLETDLEERIRSGICSEIVEERLRLEDIEGCGRGYVAVKDLAEGDALLFDTAFASAPTDDRKKDFYVLIAEKALRKGRNSGRRTSARADAQADFFHDRILKELPMKGGADRQELQILDSGGFEEEMKEQVLLCSIIEGGSVLCSEEPCHAALFAAMTLFNHSCAPNASVCSTRYTALVTAAAPIPAGSEVRISYLPAELLEEGCSEERRAELYEKRGFHCRCARCMAEGLCAAGDAEAAPAEEDPTADVPGTNAGSEGVATAVSDPASI